MYTDEYIHIYTSQRSLACRCSTYYRKWASSISSLFLQAILDAERRPAAAAGVALRPRSLQVSNKPPPTEPVNPDQALQNAPLPSTGSPPKQHTPTNVLYLTTKHGKEGVLQVHEAGYCKKLVKDPNWLIKQVPTTSQVDHDFNICGYRLLLRMDEVWPLLARSQTYPNWYTKLTLCLHLFY